MSTRSIKFRSDTTKAFIMPYNILLWENLLKFFNKFLCLIQLSCIPSIQIIWKSYNYNTLRKIMKIFFEISNNFKTWNNSERKYNPFFGMSDSNSLISQIKGNILHGLFLFNSYDGFPCKIIPKIYIDFMISERFDIIMMLSDINMFFTQRKMISLLDICSNIFGSNGS